MSFPWRRVLRTFWRLFCYKRECGGTLETSLRVAPLFERLDDLNDAPRVLRQLFSVECYMKTLRNNEQEVMIGYSDSW